MSSTLGERIRLLRKAKGLTQEQLSKQLNETYHLKTDRVMISKWETGFQRPFIDTLKCLASFFAVSLDYLNGDDVPMRHAGGNSGGGALPPYDNIFRVEKKRYPLLGEIACGKPIFAEEDRESFIMADSDIGADFCLRAKGDSMIGARILDGDIVFIRETPMVENGEIAAVVIDEEATLKRVYYDQKKGKLVLSPENPKYEPLVYVGEELNSIRILGKAVAFQSMVR